MDLLFLVEAARGTTAGAKVGQPADAVSECPGCCRTGSRTPGGTGLKNHIRWDPECIFSLNKIVSLAHRALL